MELDRRSLIKKGFYTAAALPLVSVTSCSTLNGILKDVIKKPTMNLQNFSILETSLSAFKVNFQVEMFNPNPIGFNLSGLDWKVNLAQGDVAEGRSPKGVKLAANGKALTDLEIDFKIAETANAIIELLKQGKVPLVVDVVGHLNAANHKFAIPMKFDNMLELPQLPEFSVPTFTMKEASLKGIRFGVESVLKNNNMFDLMIDAFDFDVKLSGKSVFKNQSIRNLNLVKGQSETLPLEFSINLAEIGMTMAKLASKPNLKWEINTYLKSGLVDLPMVKSGSVMLFG